MSKVDGAKQMMPSGNGTSAGMDDVYEIAMTPPDHVLGSPWVGEYEKCELLNESKETCDVRILSDGAICHGVLKMYVRRCSAGNSSSSSSSIVAATSEIMKNA